MVIKKNIKRRRRRRISKKKRRHSQKGAGYSFKLDCNLPGGVAEVVTYNDYGPPVNSQLAPPGQAQVVGVSNENLAPVEQQASQQVVQQAQQTGGKRSRRRRSRRRRRRRSNRKSRKSLRNRRRKTSMKRNRRRRRQYGGDLNCPNCNMSSRTFGCRQPLWDAKCI